MTNYAVYEILNTSTRQRYVGSSKQHKARFRTHQRQLSNNTHANVHLQAAWNKYGADVFKFRVLEKFSCEAAMQEYEQNIIRAEWDENHTKLYNAKMGVARAPLHSQEVKGKISVGVREAHAQKRGVYKGYKQSAEHSAKVSEALKGNQCAKGYKRTDAEKAAISERMRGNQNWLGKTHSEESIEKMGTTAFAVEPSGVEHRYPSINAMREALGIAGLSNILKAIASGKPFAKGPHAGWSFYTETEDNREPVPEEFRGLPRSRSEAKATGAKRYFTGTPCSRGHIYPRSAKGACILCRREGEKAKREKAKP